MRTSHAETKTAYVAFTNTDCTEGRGVDMPIALCELEATAKRIARGRYVQGSDGPVRRVELRKIGEQWYAPLSAVPYLAPSLEDLSNQKALDERNAVLEKARKAGLTEDDINALANLARS